MSCFVLLSRTELSLSERNLLNWTDGGQVAGDGAFASVNEDIDTVEPVLDIEMMDGFLVSPRSLAISLDNRTTRQQRLEIADEM